MSIASALPGRRVFVTGHTGFKGAWLTLWLQRLGATVTGYALTAEADSMYARLGLDAVCRSIEGDIRDLALLEASLRDAAPDVVIHMAAQSLVLPSYEDPLGTIQTNILGTAHVLEAVRRIDRPCTLLIVTSDKCYENRGGDAGYREDDPLGGHDVYSMTKAAAELTSASYRRSFFGDARIRVATVRAGNVIGGGDRAAGRIVPDCIRALESGVPIRVRNPKFIRPWQHVLEPLSGYLQLATELMNGRTELAEAWNFGPNADDVRTVGEVAGAVVGAWGEGSWITTPEQQPHEARSLHLNTDKAAAILGWHPRWSFDQTIGKTVAWYRAAHDGASADDLRALSLAQIADYDSAS